MPMILDRIFNFVYHRSAFDLLCWGVLAVLCITLLHRRFGKRRWWKPMLVSLLALWAAAVLCSTLLSREMGDRVAVSLVPFHSYLEVLNGGSSELLRSNLMNVFLFFPAGVLACTLLPAKWPVWKRVLVIGGVCFCFSLAIESLQYLLVLGRFEMDDVLHNTLGIICGYVLCSAASAVTPPADK